ncbi:hypothetical protein KQ096_002995 [Salmonella enterica]|uniref:Phage coat protein n=1 Tax=Salmonella enterica TaxID=28901 RepID=A0A5Z4EM31_SALER|nr:hypothetical protein [Salmonella enterica subsp. enterica serovar Bovismorbificans]ECR9158476.1 hypothetical protein [Salmonella enterica]EHQ4620410.1 hypothetical protein [Salmonella enterica]EKJ5280675.1 hypothetical protein [Salmonella enterica]EKS0238953.1 hypothetical protein [Salmonella enterica]
MRKFAKGLIASAVLTGVSVSSAFAAGTGPDYTTLTDGFDWTTTIAAVMTIGAGAVGLVLAIVGMRKVFQFVRAI